VGECVVFFFFCVLFLWGRVGLGWWILVRVCEGVLGVEVGKLGGVFVVSVG